MADETSAAPAATLSPAVTVCVDSLVAGAFAQGHAPALVLGVARGGRLAHVSTAGAEFAVPSGDVQSRIGSISKTFTATLIMALRDEGRLHLDDPISKLLDVDLPGVTPRNLLSHTSGLRREPTGAFTSATSPHRAWWERAAGAGGAALLADVDAAALIHRPWRTHHYSNLGYGLLGAVVERLTGAPWRDTVRSRVLEPLGLSRTSYEPEAPYATGYVINPVSGARREEPRHDAGAMAPAGQLWSTVTDLARWSGFWAAGAPGVLPRSTVDEMCAPAVIEDVDAWGNGYGLGVQLWRSGDRVYVGHTGSMPGYLAVMVAHRASGASVVAFANAYTLIDDSLQSLARRVLDAVLDEQPTGPVEPTAAVPSPPADVAALLGAWWWMGRRYDIGWDGDLVMRYHGEPAEDWRFTAERPDRWRCHTGMNDGEEMIVRRAANGEAIGLDVATFYFTRDMWPDLDA